MSRKLNQVALIIWTGLLGALKADRLIAECIEQTGPNTTKFLSMLALDNINKDSSLMWVPVAIAPNPECEVFAISTQHPDWPGDLLKYNNMTGLWMTRAGSTVVGVTHYVVIPPLSNAKDLI